MIVLRSEESKENTRDACERETEFLGLEQQTIHTHNLEKDHSTIYYYPDIPDDIFKELYE